MFVAILSVFGQTYNHGFVFDDDLYIVDNPNVQRGFDLQGVSWSLTAFYAANWHPLTWISHMADIQLFGMNPAGHHLVNVVWHFANAVFLFFVLRRMTGARWRSAAVSALFAVHPLHVESVAWVSERKDVLSAFFWMLTWWLYVRRAGRAGIWSRGAVLLSYALGLMAKPMLVTLPFVLLLLDYWPLGRFGQELPRSSPGGGRRFCRRLLRLALEKSSLVLLSAASCAVTYVAQNRSGAVVHFEHYSLGTRAVNALISYARYVGKALWPMNLAAYYPLPEHTPAWQVAAAGTLIAGVSWLALRKARSAPYLVAGWAFYLLTLLPVIGLVQVGEQAMADRYTYLPLTGLLVAVSWGVPALVRRRPVRAVALVAFSGLAVASLGAAARTQTGYWKDNVTLFGHTAAVTRDNYIAHNNLGLGMDRAGKKAEAQWHYTEALRIKPDFVIARNNLGVLLFEQGNLPEAYRQFSAALRIRPDDAMAYNNLGTLLFAQAKAGEAIHSYSIAVKIDPDFADAHYNLGIVLFKEGRTEEAVAHFLRAINLNPDSSAAHNNLAFALEQLGKTAEAMHHYAEALRINPDFALAQENLEKLSRSLRR